VSGWKRLSQLMAAPLVGNSKLIAFGSEYNEPSIRTGSFLPPAAADRTCGNLCVVNQTRLAGNPKIAFTKSTDGANTWIAPIAISDNPAVNVSPDGRVLTAVFTIIAIMRARTRLSIFTWRNLSTPPRPGKPTIPSRLFRPMHAPLAASQNSSPHRFTRLLDTRISISAQDG